MINVVKTHEKKRKKANTITFRKYKNNPVLRISNEKYLL